MRSPCAPPARRFQTDCQTAEYHLSMNASPFDPAPNAPEDSSPDTAEAVQRLCDQFRDTRHDLNNVFTVLLGLAELGAINPENFKRLGGAVLDRCPKVLADLQRFQDALFSLNGRLKSK